MTAKIRPYDRLKLIKRVVDDEESITSVCKEADISRTLFYRWLENYKKGGKKITSILPKGNLPENWKFYEKLSPNDRLSLIQKVQNGETVEKVCGGAGISRTIFYKWLKRYNEAPEGQKLEALWDKKPVVEKFYNQSSEEYEQAVLSAVSQCPELSSHKLVWVLPQIGGRPILGNHGVQNVLRRHNLTTYEQRLAYAEAMEKAALPARFFGVGRSILSAIESLAPQTRTFVVRASATFALALLTAIFLYGGIALVRLLSGAPSLAFSTGIIFSLISLAFGVIFLFYSFKYYIMIAIVLSFSRATVEQGKKGYEAGSFIQKLLGTFSSRASSGGGLQPDMGEVELQRKPFVSIHLAIYNEKNVVNRLLTAATSMAYENYEVVVADDSTDETQDLLSEWAKHPRVKICHRDSREGFKGGALREALKATHPRAEFVIVLDSDFIPYPDTITQFLKYFQATCGTLDFSKEKISNDKLDIGNLKLDIGNSQRIAAIQGYQWHVLNKSENWVTRGVRSEYAGSYVIERSAGEVYGGLKQIAGSVYMVRRDLLEKVGWGTSITEDFQLTLKLYEKGYKVVYTPYIQAPAEAVSTLKRLIRQRMRWAEGHSYNIKRMFGRLMFGKWEESSNNHSTIQPFNHSQPNSYIAKWLHGQREGGVFIPSPLSFSEKLEFLYLSPYYLQAAFFIVGTLSWFLAEVVFRVRLPFWTEIWGWSLVLTNLFALPLMNMVGLFLEEAEEKDYLGLFSFVAISYIVAPFQAYAAVKGFLAKEEGPWFRTPKTGRITDTFTPGRFYRYVRGIFGRPAPVGVQSSNFKVQNLSPNPYLALASAHNQFNSFGIKPRRLRWIGKATLVILLLFTMTILFYSRGVPEVLATNPSGTFLLYNDASAVITGTVSWQLKDTGVRDTLDTVTRVSFAKNAANGTYMQWAPNVNNSTTQGTDCSTVGPDGRGWVYDVAFGSGGSIASGTWTFAIRESDDNSNPTGHWDVCVWRVTVSGGTINTSTLLFTTEGMAGWPTTDIWNAAVNNPSTATASQSSFSLGPNEYLYVEYYNHVTADTGQGGTRTATFATGDVTETNDPLITTPAITIPENAIVFLTAVALIPYLVHLFIKRRKQQEV